MLDHDFESVAPRLFTHLCPNRYVAANDLLKCCTERRKDIARSNDDAADDAERLGHAKVRKLKGGCRHLMRNRISTRTDFIRRWLWPRIDIHSFHSFDFLYNAARPFASSRFAL